MKHLYHPGILRNIHLKQNLLENTFFFFAMIGINLKDQLEKKVNSSAKSLTHWRRVTHICVSKLTSIGSEKWIGAMHQCWNIVYWTPRNKHQWNSNQTSYIFIRGNPFENIVWKMATICFGLSVLRCLINTTKVSCFNCMWKCLLSTYVVQIFVNHVNCDTP